MNNFFNRLKTFINPLPKDGGSSKRSTSFQRLWEWLTAPSKNINDASEKRNAQLAASFLLAILLLDFIGGLARVSRMGFIEAFRGSIGIALVALLFSYFLSRTKWYHGAIFLFSLLFSSLGYMTIITEGNQADAAVQILIYVPLSLIVASSFVSAPAVFLLVGLNVGAYFAIQAFGVNLPENFAAQVGIITVMGVVLMLLTSFRKKSEEINLEELKTTNRELEILSAGMEKRVVERTKALETSAEVSRRLTSILDPVQLANAVVNEVRDAYDYYYTQIYLFDKAGENLVLAAGTGTAGAEMLKRGHSLPKGRGLVGRAAQNKEPVLVSDTSQAPDWLPNDLLPNTKAEAVVPIFIGDQVLGVLDVQDEVTNDITAEDITLLESLASQVAISLQNAESYARADAALQEAKSLVENAVEGIAILDLKTLLWVDPNENFAKLFGMTPEEMVTTGPKPMSPPTQPDGRESGEKAAEMINTAMEKGSHRFEWVHTTKQGVNFDCEIGLVRLPGDYPRLRQSILDITERQSLQKLTAQRARQQEDINLITQKIQAATTIEEAMQVAARELGHALGNRQAMVTLEPEALTDKQ